MASEREKPFIEDIYKKNLLYARLIRADKKVGKILSINIPEELKKEANFIIAGAQDLSGDHFIKVDGDRVPIFAETEIDFPGQPVLIAAHPDQRRLFHLSNLIEIEVEERDIFLLQQKIPRMDEISSRIVSESRHSNGDAETLVSTADTIIQNDYFTGMQEHYYSGHQGVIIEPIKNGLSITCSTEWPHLVRQNIAHLFNLTNESVIIQNAKKSPSFGGKLWFPALLACQGALLTQKTNKGIRLILSKEEDILYTTKRAPVLSRRINALNKKKQLIAQKIEVYIDGGSYPVFTRIMLETAMAGINGSYKEVPSSVIIRILKTDRPSMDFFSGTGIAPILFSVERDEDALAFAAGKDPMEWRFLRLNKEAKEGELPDLLEECASLSDYRRKRVSSDRQQIIENGFKTIHRKRGIGISCGYQGNGLFHKRYLDPEYSIIMEMKDKKSLNIYTSALPASHRTSNLWKIRASELMDINKRNISIINTTTEDTPNSGPPFLYDHLYAINALITRGSSQLRAKSKEEKYPLSVKLNMNELPLNQKPGTPFRGKTWGSAAVEIEVNPVTLETEPIRIFLEIDCGSLYHREYALQRIKTAVMQSLHWISVNQELKVLNNRLNLTMSLPLRLPEIEIILKENPEEPPRGIVELVFNILPAAYLSAASQALNQKLNTIPLKIGSMEETR